MGIGMWLAGFPTAALGTAVVLVGVVASLGGLFLVRRAVPHAVLKQHNDVVGFVYAVVGVVYAVLLAFTIVVCWEQYEGAARNVEDEASAVSDLYRDARGFGESDVSANVIQAALVGYAQAVVWEEWTTMAKGEQSQWARAQYELLWPTFYDYRPTTAQQVAFYSESLRKLNELGDHRRARLLDARSELPSIFWILLIAGGGLTIAFTYLYGLESAWIHAVIVASLSGLICFCLFLLLSLAFPFTGGTAIQPEPFQQFIVDK
jgi:hypothetical protein